MTALPEKPLLRIEEVADFFDVTERTVRLWIAHGLLIAEKYRREESDRGVIRITRESVVQFRLKSRVGDEP